MADSWWINVPRDQWAGAVAKQQPEIASGKFGKVEAVSYGPNVPKPPKPKKPL